MVHALTKTRLSLCLLNTTTLRLPREKLFEIFARSLIFLLNSVKTLENLVSINLRLLKLSAARQAACSMRDALFAG